MNKIILVDGNNLLFRSYYATAYNGNFMKNSKGFPTNALFGFTNMMNKIIEEEKPNYIMVAFDKGKTFRHDKYDNYKAGRIEMPNELKLQFPVAKELLIAMGIKYFEIDNFEADDIIGTFASYCDKDPNFIGTIISSDKDLLQLISDDIDIKLLKQKDYIRYNKKTFKEEYKFDPIKIIDLKSLMGDSSDNIPGVKGIGEKTALKLIQDYGSLDGIYQNIDSLSGKLKEKLLSDKENAYMSFDIATIVDAPINIDIEETKYNGKTDKLNIMYEELEFYSLIKKEKVSKDISYKIVNTIDEININNECSIYLDTETNYHKAKINGMSIYDGVNAYYVPFELLKQNPKFLKENIKYTYDLKKTYVALKWYGIELENVKFDTMLAGYLLDYNIKDDIAYLANTLEYDIPFHDKTDNIKSSVLSSKFIFETKKLFEDKLIEEEMQNLYFNIELPLSIVLGDMEYNGVCVDKNILNEMGEEIKIKIELISKDIFNMAGMEFNISSPIQLGNVLFEKLNLPHSKKGKNGYSTAIDVLNKLRDKHPIIDLIIEYRMLTKLYTTYIEGLKNSIMDDGKIHTIYQQALTRTGRLSSIEPNLQNIPIRYEYGKLIRKAFIPSNNGLIISGDYSQIELRILAHMSKVNALIEAFKSGMDIHTKTASDIFHVSKEEVTSQMRRIAKAVNFGIIYGISSFGLGENLKISSKEAGEFINKYFETYPGVKKYMDETISLAHINGYVKTLFNRKRNIPELNNTNYIIRSGGERIALNTPIQGTSADIIKMAMVKIMEVFKEKNIQSKMILQVHDELIFDVIREEKDIVIKIVEDIMENVCKLDVPLNVDMEYGNNWYEAK